MHSADPLAILGRHHPLVVEGMGGYDPRDPAPIARAICRRLEQHWQHAAPTKPVLLVTQGDPLEARGISAITRLLSESMDLPRALIYLDPQLADYHARDADRFRVLVEVPYSILAGVLVTEQTDTLQQIETRVDDLLADKNARRTALGKAPLAAYYRTFARLQEVTKAACKELSGAITVAHTSRDISEFSVTSFCQVGIELGLITPREMISGP